MDGFKAIEGFVEQARNMKGISKDAIMFALEQQMDPMMRMMNALNSGQPVLVAAISPMGVQMLTLTPDDVAKIKKQPVIIKDDVGSTKAVDRTNGKLIIGPNGRAKIAANLARHCEAGEKLDIHTLAAMAAQHKITKKLQVESVRRSLDSTEGKTLFQGYADGQYKRKG